MNPDGAGLTRLTTNPGDDQATWAPDGSEIAFNRYTNGNQDVYVMRADGGGLKRLTKDGASSSPAWSPDGTRIAFARETPGTPSGKAEIYVMDPDGTHVTKLTDDPLRKYTPAWSPDGSRIAFMGYSQGPPPSPTRIYVMNADGSAMRTIGPDNSAWPSWSPDGTKIAFVNEDNGSLYVINSDGSGLRRVVATADLPGGSRFPPNFTSRPAWSPDGTKLLFAAGDATSSHLYKVGVDGSRLVQLTQGSVQDEGPAWSGSPASTTPHPNPSAPAALTKGTARDDPQDGVFVLTPRGWSFLERPSRAGVPRTLFAIASYPIQPGGECAPLKALDALPADGALAWIVEYQRVQQATFPPRPSRFSIEPSSLGGDGCSGNHPTYVFRFQDMGRDFEVHVVFGARAGQPVRDEMLASLSSLVVDRCPPAEPPVRVSKFGTLEPYSGRPGERVTLSGPTGRDENWFWAPLNSIEVWWSRAPIGIPQQTGEQHLLVTVAPGTTCSFSVDFRVPNVSPGRYLVSVLGYSSDGFGVMGERRFTVTR